MPPQRGPDVPGATAIVLAGGRSSRFGRDKLAEPLDGRPLLDHAVDAVAIVAREVVVVGPPRTSGDPAASAPTAGRTPAVPVRTVGDPEPFGGPLVGLLAGLEAARQPLALLVGGDMPGLAPPVLAALLVDLDASPAADAAALEHGGAPQPLPLALRVDAVAPVVRQLLADGERSLRGLTERLDVRVLSADEWRPLDPPAATLRDVDEPGDLDPAGWH